MDFKQLQSYITAVQYKSFSIAAEKLGISQPTISIHIKNLEEELNTKLVVRTAKSFALTERGQEFYECIKNMVKLKDNLVERWERQERKIIYMGVSTISSAYILPEVVPKFREIYNDVLFNVTQRDSSDIIDAVQKGNYDIGLVGMKTDSKELVFEEFYRDRLVVITPVREQALKLKEKERNGKKVPFYQLLKYPLILREHGSACGKSTDMMFSKLGMKDSDINVVARLNDQEAIKNLVIGGLGIAVISRKAVEEEVASGKLLAFELPENIASHSYYITYQQDFILKPYVKDFVRFLKEHYDK